MQDAATAVLTVYGDEILSFIHSRLRDRVDSDEAFAMFAEDLWNGLPSLGWRSSVRTWVYTLARNATVRYASTNNRRAARNLPLSCPGAVAAMVDRVRETTECYKRTAVKDHFRALREQLDPGVSPPGPHGKAPHHRRGAGRRLLVHRMAREPRRARHPQRRDRRIRPADPRLRASRYHDRPGRCRVGGARSARGCALGVTVAARPSVRRARGAPTRMTLEIVQVCSTPRSCMLRSSACEVDRRVGVS